MLSGLFFLQRKSLPTRTVRYFYRSTSSKSQSKSLGHLETLRMTVAKENSRRIQLSKDLHWRSSNLAKEFSLLNKRYETYNRISMEMLELYEMGKLENTQKENKWIRDQLLELENELEQVVQTVLFTDIDKSNCWLELSSGAGGDDAMDFTEILANMYINWGEHHNKGEFKIKLEDCTQGENAGYRKARLYVSGNNYCYGWLKGETGVHRLVRQSPFNKTNTRETSFARVECVPHLVEEDDTDCIEILPTDIEVQTYKSSGAGGQHANTTDSAVRMIHTPTKITVTSSQQRSQHANRKHCMSLLLGKLKRISLEEREKEMHRKYTNYDSNEFGYHFRSYHLITGITKDKRSSYVCANANQVLFGDGKELQKILVENLHSSTTRDDRI